MNRNALQVLARIKGMSQFDKGIGTRLPEAYKKFFKEWKFTTPTAVHYVPEEGRWKRDEVTGQVFPIQNIPIPIKFPVEANEHIWGGEGVIQGFQKRDEHRRRVPYFWTPQLKRSVVYSEILDKYISVIITERALRLINASFGFDHYILKTPACDLQTLLPLRLKRKMLEELQKGCLVYSDNPEKQAEVLGTYQQYLEAYTPEEIEWYGLSFTEASEKMKAIIAEENKIVPLKNAYRLELIEKLKMAKAESADTDIDVSDTASWIEKINPFGKKKET